MSEHNQVSDADPSNLAQETKSGEYISINISFSSVPSTRQNKVALDYLNVTERDCCGMSAAI